MRQGRMVPTVELEIPTQPHSTGCRPSTTATNKTAGPKFKLFVRETRTSHTAVISLAREKRCHKCAECRLLLHGRRVGQEIFLFTGNRRLELAAAVFHAPLVTTIWWCGLSFGTATWPAIRVNRPMNMGDVMMLGRGRCREGGAENDHCRKQNRRLGAHVESPVWLFGTGFNHLPVTRDAERGGRAGYTGRRLPNFQIIPHHQQRTNNCTWRRYQQTVRR
jgi:hypothetical protein